jgi:2,3-bisphosphoglycerate-independent phosphoglycerate mutase
MAKRKYLIIVPDGAADLPQEALGGRTPLEVAKTSHLDALAQTGEVGLAQTILPELEPGSDVAMLSILGYDPRQYYSGRAPLEAASMGVDLAKDDAAFRCNLVSSDGEKLLSYNGGGVSTEEARELIELINRRLGTPRRKFYPGLAYRHLMVWSGAPVDMKTTPPHDIQGQEIQPHLPQGDFEEALQGLMFDSLEILDHHPINRRRREEGKLAANMIWLWGQGRAPKLPLFSTRWGVQGAMIAAVDLTRGIAKYAGLSAPTVPGATGEVVTDFAAKAAAAAEALETRDFVLVHIESPDEAGHQGEVEKKIWAIEQVDEKIVGPLGDLIKQAEGRLLILPDHRTPIALRTHSREPVPFILWPGKQHAAAYSEAEAEATGLRVEEGFRLIERLFAE